MTTQVRSLPRSEPLAGAARRRVGGLLRTELLLYRRLGVLMATAVVALLWTVVVRLVPPDVRATVVAFVLLTDVTALGFLFVPALLVLERSAGVEPAMRTTPVRPAERVGVRVGSMTVLSLLAGAAVATVGGATNVPVALVGVATTSVLVGLVAVAAVGSASTLTTFLLRAPLIAAPLVAPALLHTTGLVDTPLLYVSPVTSAVDMFHGRIGWAGVGWQLAWIASAALVVASGAQRAPVAGGDMTARPPDRVPRRGGASARWAAAGAWSTHAHGYSRVAAMRSFVRADRRGLVRDGLLVVLAASVPVLAVVGRVVGTAGVTWMRTRHDLDVSPYLPVAWVILLVVHTPVMCGALTGLLLLEDRDAGLLPAIATTRASLTTLLGYRLTATAVATAVGLAIALPVAGVHHPAGGVGLGAVVCAAAALSTVPAMLMAALATNRVQGVAVMKIIGLPLYLPIASFVVAGPLRWAFAPLPSSWVMWSLWAVTPAAAVAFAVVAVALSGGVTALLARRALRGVSPAAAARRAGSG